MKILIVFKFNYFNDYIYFLIVERLFCNNKIVEINFKCLFIIVKFLDIKVIKFFRLFYYEWIFLFLYLWLFLFI